MLDIKKVEADAKAEVAKERGEKAKAALIKKFRDLENARGVVKNIEREIDDLKASIADGSFS